MSDKNTLLNEYRLGIISADKLLDILEDDDFYNSFYAFKLLEIGELDKNQRKKAFDMVLTNTNHTLNFLISMEIKNSTDEEKRMALKAICQDYSAIQKLMENYFSVKRIDVLDIVNLISGYDRSKALNNGLYNEAIVKTARALKHIEWGLLKPIVDVCSKNLELFEQCIDFSVFNDNLDYVFSVSDYYFNTKARRSMQRCLNYCSYFSKQVNKDHLEFLVKRIQGSKEFGIARDLLDKRYTFPQFTQDQIERLEALVVMKELQGGF